MPSRNSFSIRKLFTSPRRLSRIADETTPSDDRFNSKRRSDVSTSSCLSGDSRGSTPSRGSTASGASHGSHGSRGCPGSSTIFHPDSSISITTPQAERGLTDNVDHELSQEEIDRIKAVVAAAAAAAAGSLRLRMDESSEGAQTIQTIKTIQTIQAAMFTDRRGLGQDQYSSETNEDTTNTTDKKRSESTESAETRESAQNTENTGDGPQLPRKKNRRIPQPIVVPPRPIPRTADAQPARRSIDQRRDKNEPETNDKDGSDKNSKTEKTEKGDKGDRSDRNDRIERIDGTDKKERKSQHRRLGSQGSQHSKGRRGSLGAKSGKSQQHHQFNSRSREAASGPGEQRKTGRSDKGVEKQKQHEAGATLPTATVQEQVQLQLAAGNSQGQTGQAEGDKHHSRPKHSQTGQPTQTTPKMQQNKQSSQDRQDKQDKQDGKDKQKDAAADERRAASQREQKGEASSTSLSSTPKPSLVAVSSRSSQSPPSLPPLPLYTTIPLASITSSRASIPACAPNLLSKALPPPPPPRVSSYFATRSSWKSKTETATPLITKSKPKINTSQSKTAVAHIHPFYRGQNGEPDRKKDSGIALDRSQTSLVGSSSDAYDTVSDTDNETSKVTNKNDSVDDDSGSDAGSCIDLLQALTIQPDEANLLRRQTADSTPAIMMQSSSLLAFDGDINANAANGPALRDVCTTPTFTQPRMAPTPSPSAVPSEANTLRRMMSPSPSPRPSFMGPTSRTSGTFSALSVAASPPSPKKQTRFLPLRLNKGLPDAALRIQRKRSKKAARKRDRAASNTKGQPFSDGKSKMDIGNASANNDNTANNNNSGSSRWTLPDNVTELFNGRLFSRMEVNETLPFEKLQAIRESRALAQKQLEEAEEMKKVKQLQNEQDEKKKLGLQNQKQQQDLVDAERALTKELQRPQAQSQPPSLPQASKPEIVDPAATAPLETLLECEEEELQVSPLEPEDVPVDADGNPIESNVSMPVSPPVEPYQLPSLPMPPHIASQMVWPGSEDHNEEKYNSEGVKFDNSNTTKTKALFLSMGRDEPDGSTTPIEPFHMEDLPSRIGAAGVRVSILLPVEEEEAYFASSVARHKERRRREREEQERKEERTKKSEEETANLMPDPPKSPLDEIGPFPLPPTKNPMRFQSYIRRTAQSNRAIVTPPPLTKPPPTQPIPQVTVTDVDSQNRRRRPVLATARKSLGKTPKSSFFLSSSSLIPPSASSSLLASSSTSSMVAMAAAASAMPQHRDDATYVYLSATPFSLVMPTYRHGPIRLNRSDLLDAQANSRNSYDRNLYHHHHHHPNIATVDDTLDWTAFQMAILGGAGDLFQDTIDYGQISAAEADETDRLADWFRSLNIKPERLLTSPDEDKEWVRAVPPPPMTAEGPAAAPAPVPAARTHHTQRTAGPQWTSISSSIRTAASSSAAVTATAPSTMRSSTHSRTTTSTSISTTASGYSSSGGSSNRDSAVAINAANKTTNPGLTAQTASLALPFPMSRNNSTVNSSYAVSRDNRIAAKNPANIGNEIPPQMAQPRTIQNLHAPPTFPDVRASFASVASYESMPQSPMADLIMTRGADGKEYVTPMGYNLSHDLGDYLQWEKDNVYAVALEEPR